MKVLRRISCVLLLLSLVISIASVEKSASAAGQKQRWVIGTLTYNSTLNTFSDLDSWIKPTEREVDLEEVLKDTGVIEIFKIKKRGVDATIKTDLEDAEIEKEITIPHEWYSEFKCYMPYTAIGATGSPQYKYTRSDKAHTSKYGIRMYKDRYFIACGSRVATKIGTKIDVVLTNGNIIPCILGDQKADGDTQDRIRGGDNSITEFLVDYSVFNSVKDGSGTVNFVPGWSGKIKKLVVYK